MNTPILGWAPCSQPVGALDLGQSQAVETVLHYYDGTASTSLCVLFTRPDSSRVKQTSAMPVPPHACPWCAERVRDTLSNLQAHACQSLDPEEVERSLDELRIYALRHPRPYRARAVVKVRSVVMVLHNGEEATVTEHPDHASAHAHADRINEALNLKWRDL